MDEPENLEPRIELREENLPKNIEPPRPRAVGSPLARGESGKALGSVFQNAGSDSARGTPIVDPSPNRANALHDLDDPANNPISGPMSGQPSSLQRAVKGMRMALPFVQKILPLLEGQVLSTVANLLAPRPPAPAPPVNLAPLEGGITELQIQHRKLREQITEQNASFKKVEDRLEMVQEATDRNTLEQQELLEDLKSVRRKVTVFATISLLLLFASVGLNVVLYLYMRGILH